MSLKHCLEGCLQACSSCCVSRKTKKRYPYVQYDRLQQASAGPTSITPEDMVVHEIPLEKIFTFPQDQQDYPLHPQIAHEAVVAITHQPTATLPQAPVGLPQFPSETRFLFPNPALLGIPEEPLEGSSDVLTAKEKRRTFGRHSRRRKRSREEDQLYVVKCSSDSIPPVGEELLQEGDPLLEFSLYFDVHCRVLTVHLHKAHNLPIEDKNSKLVSSVGVSLLPDWEDAFETKIATNTLNPVYDETFTFQGILPEEVQGKTVVFRVYHHITRESDQMVGMVYLPLNLVDLFGSERVIKKISQRKELEKVHSLLVPFAAS